MFNNFVKFLKRHLFVLLLALVWLVLVAQNFPFGTFLTGWDNLHPEFNFPLNIRRSFNAVWQEYQGLGLLGGMGHASDLPRELFLLICSLFLPTSFLRYFYTFLMLLIGPLGIYFLIKSTSEEAWIDARQFLHTGRGHPPTPGEAPWLALSRSPSEVINLVSFLGGLFYLFNLATVQTFYVPFSAFTTQFAFLPWLVFLLILNLKKPGRKNLFLFFIINILAVPQAYVPTVFIVSLIALVPFLFFWWLKGTNKFKGFKMGAKLVLVIFLVNAFWLLPFLYFTLTKSRVVVESKINQMISEEVFLQNKLFGDLKNVVLLKGFWFDNRVLDEKGGFIFMLEPWINHLKNPHIETIGYLFSAVILLGVLYCLKEKKSWVYQSFLFLFIFSFTMLATATPPFSLINAFLRKYIPLFAQVFRFPYTKFSLLALFSYTIFFTLGLELILSIFSRLWKGLSLLLSAACLILLFIFNLPAFKGNLIYKRVRVKIPQEYFALFDFFKKQARAARIANFPQSWHWGWSYYKWGYTGSGFLWYALEQPVLDRAFDVWSDKNEGYYWEVSYAAYSHNPSLFEKVLEKYQINWILIDENIYALGPPRALQIENLKEMLETSKMISFVESFGRLKLYKVTLPLNEKNFVFFVKNPARIKPPYKWANKDQAFLEHGLYHSSPNPDQLEARSDYYYPFRELFTNNNVQDKSWKVEVDKELIVFKTKLPNDRKWIKESLNLKSLNHEEKVLLFRTDVEEYELSPKININLSELEVKIAKHNLVRTEEIDYRRKIFRAESCDQTRQGKYGLNVVEEEKRFLRLWSQDASSCTAFNFPFLEHDYSYLLEVESRNISGKDLLFYVINETTKKSALEILIPKSKSWEKNYYILPPGNPYGKGYTLHFDNVSLGQEKTINDIRDIKIYPIPFNFLKKLKFSLKGKGVGEFPSPSHYSDINFTVEKRNPSSYQILIEETKGNQDETLLVLSQSFDPGWKAYTFEKEKFLEIGNWKLEIPKIKILGLHVLVNNWANGWIIDGSRFKVQDSRIRIIYLPQYLEYLGFLLMGVCFGLVFKLKFPEEKKMWSNSDELDQDN